MMDGYSVTDAASVLGVPEGRVWELLARGVLSGTPHGDSMRVFLKSQPAPIAPASQPEEPPRTNGNGGSHPPAGEASAFRELLTEFRNLTERYGQALLALGEARGEVASLRSRVDLLEARIDLRLPASIEAPIAWEPLARPASVEAPTPASVEPAPPDPAPVRRAGASRKSRTPREATAEFADALARAQDPTAADLPAGPPPEEPEAPVAASQVAEEVLAAATETITPDTAPEPAAAEIAPVPEPEVVAEAVVEAVAAREREPLPVEAPVAETTVAEEAVAEPPTAEPGPQPAMYSADVVEPDWFADGDFAWLDAAELEARSPAATPTPAPEPIAAPEPEPTVAALPEPIPEPEPIAAAPESLAPVLPEPVAAPIPQPEPVAAVMPEPISEPAAIPQPAPVAPETVALPIQPARPVQPAVEEPAMPAAEGVVVWPEPAPEPTPEPATVFKPEPSQWPAADVSTPVPAPEPPLLNLTEAELAQLAREEGWDEAEVATIRAMIRQPSAPPARLPGAAELDDAMNALKAVPVQAPAGQPGREWSKPAGGSPTAQYDDWAFEVEAPPPAPISSASPYGAPRRPSDDPGWLRTRQGPAATAYRRLRRLFTG